MGLFFLLVLRSYHSFGDAAIPCRVLVINLYQLINDKNAYGVTPEPVQARRVHLRSVVNSHVSKVPKGMGVYNASNTAERGTQRR